MFHPVCPHKMQWLIYNLEFYYPLSYLFNILPIIPLLCGVPARYSRSWNKRFELLDCSGITPFLFEIQTWIFRIPLKPGRNSLILILLPAFLWREAPNGLPFHKRELLFSLPLIDQSCRRIDN